MNTPTNSGTDGGASGGAVGERDGERGVAVVTVHSQRCDRPMLHRGVGTVLEGGLILTAGHVVDGDLRRLEVDGAAARVVGLDPRLDLAVLRVVGSDSVATDDPRLRTEALEPGPVTVVTPERTLPTQLLRSITLRVDDVTERSTHERPAIELGLGVEGGHSGAPVLDRDGAIVGVVILTHPRQPVSYAVRLPSSTLEMPPPDGRSGCVHE